MDETTNNDKDVIEGTDEKQRHYDSLVERANQARREWENRDGIEIR